MNSSRLSEKRDWGIAGPWGPRREGSWLRIFSTMLSLAPVGDNSGRALGAHGEIRKPHKSLDRHRRTSGDECGPEACQEEGRGCRERVCMGTTTKKKRRLVPPLQAPKPYGAGEGVALLKWRFRGLAFRLQPELEAKAGEGGLPREKGRWREGGGGVGERRERMEGRGTAVAGLSMAAG